MYGVATIVILMSGLKNISYLRFGIHSAISIGLWVLVVGGFGYFCAEIMMDKLNFITDHKLEVIGVLVLIGLIYWFFVRRPHEKYCFKEQS